MLNSQIMRDTKTSSLNGIVIAAGNSSRLGQPKQLLQDHQQTLLERSINLVRQHTEQTLVVLGYQAQKIKQSINQTLVQAPDIQWIENPNWPQGMGSSISTGAERLGSSSKGLLIMLCDQWRLDSSDIAKLVEAWQQAPDKIICATYRQNNDKLINGAPAIFPNQYFADLIALQTMGAKNIIEKNPKDRISVFMPDAQFDIDTPADLLLFNQSMAAKN